MGIAHVLNIRYKLVGKVTVGIEVSVIMHFPRARMNLIDIDGRLINIRFPSLFQPRRVAPFIAVKLVILRSSSRSCFTVESIRVSLVNFSAVSGDDMILVVVIDINAGDKALPYASVVKLFHRSGVCIPVVEVSDDADALCMRSPDTERGEIFFALCFMRAEVFVRLDVFPLIKEVQGDIIAVCLFFGHFMHRPVCFINSERAKPSLLFLYDLIITLKAVKSKFFCYFVTSTIILINNYCAIW